MGSRVQKIREAERTYHEACYDNYKLFEAGTWLHRPVKTVMDTLGLFADYQELLMLDLGCGVGRNTIPMAQALQGRQGEVVGVDLLETALEKLMQYSGDFKVQDRIVPVLSDIGEYEIQPGYFDYIVAVSSLEHVESEEHLGDVLRRMVRGTRERGIHCLIMGTCIQEVDVAAGVQLEPMMELNLQTEPLQQMLDSAYAGWDVLLSTVRPLEFAIDRDGRDVRMTCDCLTYVVRRG